MVVYFTSKTLNIKDNTIKDYTIPVDYISTKPILYGTDSNCIHSFPKVNCSDCMNNIVKYYAVHVVNQSHNPQKLMKTYYYHNTSKNKNFNKYNNILEVGKDYVNLMF